MATKEQKDETRAIAKLLFAMKPGDERGVAIVRAGIDDSRTRGKITDHQAETLHRLADDL